MCASEVAIISSRVYRLVPVGKDLLLLDPVVLNLAPGSQSNGTGAGSLSLQWDPPLVGLLLGTSAYGDLVWPQGKQISLQKLGKKSWHWDSVLFRVHSGVCR